jgi:hypothetical protein
MVKRNLPLLNDLHEMPRQTQDHVALLHSGLELPRAVDGAPSPPLWTLASRSNALCLSHVEEKWRIRVIIITMR